MNKYSSQKSIVAFIDILGAAKKIHDAHEDTLNKIHMAYDDALNAFFHICENDSNPPKIRIFSDNIVISKPCGGIDVGIGIFQIVLLCAMIQEHLLQHNILVRGGITIGDYFIDDVMILGDALVEAYKLESGVAIYPRIILQPQVIAITHRLLMKPDQAFKEYTCFFRQDHDGLVYVDYFHDFRCIEHPMPRLVNALNHIQSDIRDEKDIKVLQKLLWHQNYLKRKLNEFEIAANNASLSSQNSLGVEKASTNEVTI